MKSFIGEMRLGATATTESPLDGPCELLRVGLPWNDLPAERAALLLRDEENSFALIGRWAGGGALIGSEPVAVAPSDADPFALIEALPKVAATDHRADMGPSAGGARPDRADETVATDPFAVGGGWFGYLGYGLGAEIERLDPPPPPGGPTLPLFSLAFYDHLLHQDADGRWWFEALVTAEREAAIQARLESIRSRIPTPASHPSKGHIAAASWTASVDLAPRPFSTEPWRATPEPQGHGLAVEACRERIHAGDLFQANICQRLSSRLSGDPLDLFVAAAPRLRPDRAAYLAGSWGALASLSPELFLERHGRRVRTAPIKGTRPRPVDPDESDAQRSELAGSDKDRAENQMIVDMARNDLGRVCLYGSIRVDTTAEPRPHTGVWHLVSEVSGELHPTLGDQALLRATFPPASVTGAPKIAAQNVIAELESSRREAYTGAIGFASPLAGLELSVTIRSFEFGPELVHQGQRGREAWLGVGGGIVADSDPEAEAEECRTKALPLLGAIEAELEPPEGSRIEAAERATPFIPRPLRAGPKPTPRPDPEAGIFETIRVQYGRPLHLGRHLSRMATSAGELYGIELPDALASEIQEAAASAPQPGRLRVDLRPGAHRGLPVTTILTSELPEPRSSTLAPVSLPGGLGPHKWADRFALDRLALAVDPHIPLLCDLDGYVLEAAHASLFADLGDGRLITPPLDGRILPGIARARVLTGEADLPKGLTHVSESPLQLAELAGAKAIYITNALFPALRRVRI